MAGYGETHHGGAVHNNGGTERGSPTSEPQATQAAPWMAPPITGRPRVPLGRMGSGVGAAARVPRSQPGLESGVPATAVVNVIFALARNACTSE